MRTAWTFRLFSLDGALVGLATMISFPENPGRCLFFGFMVVLVFSLLRWAFGKWGPKVTITWQYANEDEWHYLCGAEPQVNADTERQAFSADAA